MKLSKILMMTVFLLSILTLSAASASEDNITSDDVAVGEDIQISDVNESAGTFEDVQKAIDETPENGSVQLEGTYYSTGHSIIINKSITITNTKNETSSYMPVVFDGQNLNRILEIRNGTVTLNGITFINGKIIYNESTEEWGYGAAIYTESPNLICRDCSFINNTADDGSAIYAMNPNLNCYNCSFINNKGNFSGAVFCVGNNLIEKCYFENNTALEQCGCIYARDYQYPPEETLKIKDCVFTNNPGNVAVIYSSIYYSESYEYYTIGNLEIDGCSFTNNNGCVYAHNNAKITNTDFINNTWVIYVYGEDFNMKNSKIINNSYEGEIIDLSFMADAKITDCTFKNNRNGLLCAWGIYKLTIDGKKYSSFASLNDNLKTIYFLNAECPSKFSTTYKSGETLNIKLTNRFTKEPDEDYITIKVYTGKKYKIYYKGTNSKGIAKFKASKLSVGTHKVEITVDGTYKFKKITSIINVKWPTILKAHKVTNKYRKSQFFKVTVKYETSKGKCVTINPVKNTYIKLKIDGKTYKVKTNSKGVAKFNTKTLKVGKHNVKISSGNANYDINAKSTITIK